jgi:hypothetical protein
MVLLVPETPDFRRQETESILGAPIRAFTEPLRQSMKSAAERIHDEAEALKAGNDETARLLKSRGFLAAIETDESLREDTAILRKELTENTKRQQAYLKRFEQIAKQVNKDLEDLEQRFG